MSEALLMEPREPVVRDPATPPRPPDAIAPVAVRHQLEKILASRAFARSPRISRFLGFVVEQTLGGQEDKLKEYLLGVEVFNRMDSFDPRIDSIVRVEARRLRYKLEKYYETEGREDSVHILFRKGCYVPAFVSKRASDQSAADVFEFPHLNIIENQHAFTLYAKARHHMGRWTADGIAESISGFTHALAEDPDCAGAHSGLAGAWTLAGLLGILPARDVMQKARASATAALDVNSKCAEAYAVLAMTSAILDFEWNDAEERIRRAILLNPCESETRLWYGLYALLAGRLADGSRELRKAQQASPVSLTANLAVGFACHVGRAYDEALMQYRLAQELNPSSYAPHLAMGLLFTDQQMFEQAQHSLSQASQLSPRNPTVLAMLVHGHASAGRMEAAQQVLAELQELAARQYVPAICLSLAQSAVGDPEAAISKLEEAYEERSPWLGLVRSLPAFARIRDDARYPALCARIGLA